MSFSWLQPLSQKYPSVPILTFKAPSIPWAPHMIPEIHRRFYPTWALLTPTVQRPAAAPMRSEYQISIELSNGFSRGFLRTRRPIADCGGYRQRAGRVGPARSEHNWRRNRWLPAFEVTQVYRQEALDSLARALEREETPRILILRREGIGAVHEQPGSIPLGAPAIRTSRPSSDQSSPRGARAGSRRAPR